MIRRWFILGILTVLMVSLLWNFYREVVVYHAMDAVKEAQNAPAKQKKQQYDFVPAWNGSIVSDNLFSKTRDYVKPTVTPVTGPEIQTEAPVPPELKLSGIILDQYGEFVAFIQEGQAPAKRARKGDEIAGALVVDITEREVKLLWNDQEITLSMKKIQTVPTTTRKK